MADPGGGAATISPEERHWMVALLCVTSVGMIINTIVILAMLRAHQLRRSSLNLLLVAVQVSDLCLQLGVVVNLTRSLDMNLSPGHLPGCQVFGTATIYWAGVSYYSLTAVAISRYRLIVQQRKWGCRQYVALVAGSAALAFVAVITMVSSMSASDANAGRLVCVPAWSLHGTQLVVTVPVLLGGTLSAAASSVCYYRISCHIKQSKLTVQSTLSSKHVDVDEMHDVVAVKRLFRVNLLFFLGWAMYLAEIVYEVAVQSQVTPLYDQLAILSICLTLAVAPLLWVWGNRQLTDAIKQLFGLAAAVAVAPEATDATSKRRTNTQLTVEPHYLLNVHMSQDGVPLDYCRRRPLNSHLSHSASIVHTAHRRSLSRMDQPLQSARLRKHQSAEVYSVRRLPVLPVSAGSPKHPTQLQSHDKGLHLSSPRSSLATVEAVGPASTICIAAPPVPRLLELPVTSPASRRTHVRPPVHTPSYIATSDNIHPSVPASPALWYSPLASSDDASPDHASSIGLVSSAADGPEQRHTYTRPYQPSSLHRSGDMLPVSVPRSRVPTVVMSVQVATPHKAKVLPELPSSIHRRCTSTASIPEFLGDTPGAQMDLYSEMLDNLEARYTANRTRKESELGTSDRG